MVVYTCSMKIDINSFTYDTSSRLYRQSPRSPLAHSQAVCRLRAWGVQLDPCGTEREPHVKSTGRENDNGANGQGPACSERLHWRIPILHVIVPPLRNPARGTSHTIHVARPRTNEVTASVRVHEQCKGLPQQRKRDTEQKKHKILKATQELRLMLELGQPALAIPHGTINYMTLY
jgi:hypothetical protein